MLKVEVEGVLSFPVPPTQIATLIGQATRAPYGRGEATILDESVRKVWQLPPAKVNLGGKSWAANFDGILKQVIAGLGCEGMAVSAELYKVLVYDQGGFFLAHRDTEKAEGMFGTLVLGLPSAHRGGELVIRHAGREAVVDMSGAEVSEVSFAAFYADCEHEVRPITEGHRVCLVYNLMQSRGGKAKRGSLKAPEYEEELAAAAKLLEENLSAEGAVAKVAWLLEHQYSPDGLAFAALKAADAARVKVLAQAAERAGCAAHLGIVHIEESGAAESEYYGDRPRRWGRYGDDEEEESEDADGDTFEVIEVTDWRHYVSQWRDLRDQPVEFGEIPLAPGELLPAGALDDEKPDEQRLMEASGNEGASFERSYHRAALVIWRRERYVEVLLQAGVAAVLPYLRERIEAAQVKSAPAALRREAVAVARRLVKAWAEVPAQPFQARLGTPAKRDTMLGLLNQLGDPALLEKFIGEVMVRDYDGSENVALTASARLLGAERTGFLCSASIHRHMRDWPGQCVDLLGRLAVGADAPAKPAEREALCRIAAAAISQLDEVGKTPADDEWTDEPLNKEAGAVDATLVRKLLDVLGDLDAPELRAEAVRKFAARPELFDPVTILTPALAEVRQWDASLWEHSVRFLLRRSGRPPAAPTDWRQEVTLACSCVDCRELQAFALDPVSQTHRFRVRQDRRRHLHQQIEGHGLDMTHVTDRHGSPQTLVCTKDRRSYQRRCEHYRKDIAALGALAEQAPKTSATNAGALNRIEAARALAAKWSPG
ncbi:MAG: hypothetical protein JWQ83_1329 [Lacunisphaera sp.]|nr:hypothetical protein [Lacunisphaera sp.]